MFKRYFTSLLFVVYIEHLARSYRAYVRKHTQTVTRNTEIFDFVVFLSLLGGEVFHELTVCGILIYNKKKEANMGDNISELEQEDILNALDAGRLIGTESSRRVLSQVEIDKIVDAYNELVESKENLLELMGIAEELNKSENTRTVFTQKCVDYIPVVLRTIEALR